MDNKIEVPKEAIEDETQLFQQQLDNLSERLYEAGRKADKHLSVWATFSALTVLIFFGVELKASLFGVNLDRNVAGAVAYALACVYYYRSTISDAALGYWRDMYRRIRRKRFHHYDAFAQDRAEYADEISRNFAEAVSEYPGYVASSVLIKDEAKKHGGAAAKLIVFVHTLIIVIRSIAPYALAMIVLYSTWFNLFYVFIALLGLIVCITANVVLSQSIDA